MGQPSAISLVKDTLRAITAVSAAVLLVAAILVPSAPAQAASGSAVQASTAAVPASSAIAPAADLSQFRPGNIISDSVFFDSGTMTEAQIQAFLDARAPVCQVAVCLKNWRGPSQSRPADAMCSAFQGSSSETAASLIYKVSRACGINPQVIIVTMQKEQGLVTASRPTDYAFNFAMGYNCPDTTGCTSNGMGFSTQVYGGAWQMKRYANPPGTSRYFTWYEPGRTWNILYHPDASRNCGSSPVYIENQATANLYYYTPYQPNAAALRAGYGEGDRCSSYGNRNFFNYFSDWFGTPDRTGFPVGSVEAVQSVTGGVRVAGWARDPDTSAPIQVHLYVGSRGTAVVADLPRPDVQAAFPGAGPRHGFDVRLPMNPGETANLCVYAINAPNVGRGENSLISCQPVRPHSGSPEGFLDAVNPVEGGVEVSGWAIDPDTLDATVVHVYVDDVGYRVTADLDRPDLARHLLSHGTRRGYKATFQTTPGDHRVCVYAINAGPGVNVEMGCRTVTVGALPERGRAPFGFLEAAEVRGTTVKVSGWAIDPDTAAPITVHLYVGARGTAHLADKFRSDIARIYRSYGGEHGFSETLEAPYGRSDVCAYAINSGPGGNALLGCLTIDVAPPPASAPPIGNLELVEARAGGVRVAGWALDPDTPASIAVHVYAGGVGTALTADLARPDVGAAFRRNGDRHGFDRVVDAAPGRQNVCVYAINDAPGNNTLLSCREVTVP